MNKQMKAQKQRLADYIQQQLMRNAYEIGRQHGKAEAEAQQANPQAEAQQANPQAEAQQAKPKAPTVTPAPYWRRPK